MKLTIPDTNKFAPFLVFYIIGTSQIGVGALGFQMIISEEAGYDSWISIIIIGIVLQILMMMIYKMLKITNGDFVAIHSFTFGNVIGKLLSTLYIIIFCLQAITVLRSYIEVVQVWMFQDISVFWFGLVFFILTIYIIFGGIRVISGIAFFSVVLPIFVLPLFLFTLPYSDFTNLLPVFDHSLIEILKGSRAMSLSITGFEIILFIYPFINHAEQSQKWAHLSIVMTTFIYLYLAILTFAYFPEAMLEKKIWSTLTMWKIIEMPFMERFEYIGISAWFIIILPNICLYIWGASRILKQLYTVKQKISVPVLCIICLIGISLLSNRNQINLFSNIVAQISFYFSFIYLPILFLITLIKGKVKKLG